MKKDTSTRDEVQEAVALLKQSKDLFKFLKAQKKQKYTLGTAEQEAVRCKNLLAEGERHLVAADARETERKRKRDAVEEVRISNLKQRKQKEEAEKEAKKKADDEKNEKLRKLDQQVEEENLLKIEEVKEKVKKPRKEKDADGLIETDDEDGGQQPKKKKGGAAGKRGKIADRGEDSDSDAGAPKIRKQKGTFKSKDVIESSDDESDDGNA